MPKRPCARPGCTALVERGYCAACAARHSPKTRIERARGTACQRGYDRQWRKQRAAYLRLNPFCVDPYGVHKAMPVPATVLDHIVPHKGDEVLFKDPNNRQGMCDACHNRKTATEDSAFASPRGGGVNL